MPDLIAVSVLDPLDQAHPDLLRDPQRRNVLSARVRPHDVGAERVERVGDQRADRLGRVPPAWNAGATV